MSVDCFPPARLLTLTEEEIEKMDELEAADCCTVGWSWEGRYVAPCPRECRDQEYGLEPSQATAVFESLKDCVRLAKRLSTAGPLPSCVFHTPEKPIFEVNLYDHSSTYLFRGNEGQYMEWRRKQQAAIEGAKKKEAEKKKEEPKKKTGESAKVEEKRETGQPAPKVEKKKRGGEGWKKRLSEMLQNGEQLPNGQVVAVYQVIDKEVLADTLGIGPRTLSTQLASLFSVEVFNPEFRAGTPRRRVVYFGKPLNRQEVSEEQKQKLLEEVASTLSQ